MAYIYMVRCEDDSLYTGITKDIRRRICEHYYKKRSGAKYTKSRRICALEMVWETDDWSMAGRLEYRIKKLRRSEKEKLILDPWKANRLFGADLPANCYKPRPEYTLQMCLGDMEGGSSVDRLQQQLSFLLVLDRQKEIIRQTFLADGSRKETDAEHAWHLAIMCMVLSEYANEPIDVSKTVMMLLTHDLVEIDAGDTYAYDTKGNETKRARELKAADRIYGLLPDEQRDYLRALWDEFEAMETPEAKFANTLDKIQPVLLTDLACGKSWREHGVCKDQIMGRNVRTHEGSEVLWEHIRKIIEKNVEGGSIKGEASGVGQNTSP